MNSTVPCLLNYCSLYTVLFNLTCEATWKDMCFTHFLIFLILLVEFTRTYMYGYGVRKQYFGKFGPL